MNVCQKDLHQWGMARQSRVMCAPELLYKRLPVFLTLTQTHAPMCPLLVWLTKSSAVPIRTRTSFTTPVYTRCWKRCSFSQNSATIIKLLWSATTRHFRMTQIPENDHNSIGSRCLSLRFSSLRCYSHSLWSIISELMLWVTFESSSFLRFLPHVKSWGFSLSFSPLTWSLGICMYILMYYQCFPEVENLLNLMLRGSI